MSNEILGDNKVKLLFQYTSADPVLEFYPSIKIPVKRFGRIKKIFVRSK